MRARWAVAAIQSSCRSAVRGASADLDLEGRHAAEPPSRRTPTQRLALLRVLHASLADRRRRTLAAAVVASTWLLLSLAAGGGLLQHAPQGWPLPLRTWLTFDYTTPYALYAFTKHWAIVAVPLYMTQALGVALLAGVYTLTARPPGECGVGRKATRALRVGGFSTLGVLAAAGCCSTLTIAAATVLGPGLAAALTGVPSWVTAAVLLAAITLRAINLQRADAA